MCTPDKPARSGFLSRIRLGRARQMADQTGCHADRFHRRSEPLCHLPNATPLAYEKVCSPEDRSRPDRFFPSEQPWRFFRRWRFFHSALAWAVVAVFLPTQPGVSLPTFPSTLRQVAPSDSCCQSSLEVRRLDSEDRRLAFGSFSISFC